MKRIVQYGAYPAILLGSVWGNLCLMEAGAGFLLSTYLPVTLGSLLIIWLELQLPYRASWKPSGKDVVEDSAFLALVHVLWPKLLAMGVAFLLFDIWNGQDLVPKMRKPLLENAKDEQGIAGLGRARPRTRMRESTIFLGLAFIGIASPDSFRPLANYAAPKIIGEWVLCP